MPKATNAEVLNQLSADRKKLLGGKTDFVVENSTAVPVAEEAPEPEKTEPAVKHAEPKEAPAKTAHPAPKTTAAKAKPEASKA